MPVRLLPAALLLLAACGSARDTRCGIVTLAAPGLLLEEFTRPGRTLDSVRAPMPDVLPVRLAAGASFRSLVGQTDSGWVIGVEGNVDATGLGFGMLVVDPVAGPQGVVLYQGPPIPGAPVLGAVHVAAGRIPLLGIRAPVAGFGDRQCPLFPDSLRQ